MRQHVLAVATGFTLASIASAAARAQSSTYRAPEPAAYRVLVTGAVRYPGRVTLTPSTMTVADALAAVGAQNSLDSNQEPSG